MTLVRGVQLGEWIVLVRHLVGGLYDDGLGGADVAALPAALTVEIRAVELADVDYLGADVDDAELAELLGADVDVHEHDGRCCCPCGPCSGCLA